MDKQQNAGATIPPGLPILQPSPYYTISATTITLTDPQPYWNQYIFNYPIPHDSNQHKFKLQILKTQNRLIMIGVLDYQKQKNALYSHDSDNNMVCYYGYDTRVFPSGGYRGIGFKEGEILEVGVNRGKREIRWIVDGEVRASFSHVMLGDQDRVIMPFVQMNQTGDSVRWVQ